MAVERAKYTVESAKPPYEVRDHAPAIVAVTHVEGERDAAVNAGFQTLAGYLFGGNQAELAGSRAVSGYY